MHKDEVNVYNSRALKQSVPWKALFAINDVTGAQLEPRGVAFDGLRLAASLSAFDHEHLSTMFGGEGRLTPSFLKAALSLDLGLTLKFDNPRGLAYGWASLSAGAPVRPETGLTPGALVANGQSCRKTRVVLHRTTLDYDSALGALLGQEHDKAVGYHVLIGERGQVDQLANLAHGVKAVVLPREVRLQEFQEHPNVNSFHVLLCGPYYEGAGVVAQPVSPSSVADVVYAPSPKLLAALRDVFAALVDLAGVPAVTPLATSGRPMKGPVPIGLVAGGKGLYGDFHLNPMSATVRPWWPVLCETLMPA